MKMGPVTKSSWWWRSPLHPPKFWPSAKAGRSQVAKTNLTLQRESCKRELKSDDWPRGDVGSTVNGISFFSHRCDRASTSSRSKHSQVCGNVYSNESLSSKDCSSPTFRELFVQEARVVRILSPTKFQVATLQSHRQQGWLFISLLENPPESCNTKNESWSGWHSGHRHTQLNVYCCYRLQLALADATSSR